jgi:peptidoglycan/LPS O-acetylase OafA/YrhL
LDAIRGLAAVAVMLLHYSGLNGLNWMPRAWMAVDLFFTMSGFVLMHSYSQKINEKQLHFAVFIRLRLVRLMPLYQVGLFLGYLSMNYACRLPGGSCEPHVIPALAYGMFVLPYFTDAMWPVGINAAIYPFPLNSPAWSLFFELFVNLLFFYWLAKAKNRHIWLIICFAFFALVAAYHFNGSVNGGWGGNNFYIGFPRVIYHFFIGVLIYTQYQKYGLHSRLIAFASLTFLLVIIAANSSLASMFSLFILAPFVVLANAKIIFGGFAEQVCTWLGDISYPLYIVHWPIFQLLYMFGHLEGLTPPTRVLVMGLIAIILAWLLGILDKRVRAKLSGKSAATLKVQASET